MLSFSIQIYQTTAETVVSPMDWAALLCTSVNKTQLNSEASDCNLILCLGFPSIFADKH